MWILSSPKWPAANSPTTSTLEQKHHQSLSARWIPQEKQKKADPRPSSNRGKKTAALFLSSLVHFSLNLGREGFRFRDSQELLQLARTVRYPRSNAWLPQPVDRPGTSEEGSTCSSRGSETYGALTDANAQNSCSSVKLWRLLRLLYVENRWREEEKQTIWLNVPAFKRSKWLG